jgi:hypothetical protein
MSKVGDVRLKIVLLFGEKVDEVWFLPWKPKVRASVRVFRLLAWKNRKSTKGDWAFDSPTPS